MSVLADAVERLVQWIRDGDRNVALTGAGVSTDSGIPDFRSGSRGLWAHHDPAKVASIAGFMSDPDAFYDFWAERFGALAETQPNITHRALAALEARGLMRAVITQNIDGLHQSAGSERVIEVHGNWRRARCMTCGSRYETERAIRERLGGERSPRCDLCGGLIKPEVVLFGEGLPPAFQEAEREVDQCHLLIVLGSSLEVWPVAGLVPRAHDAKARVAVINRDKTPADSDADLVIHAELKDAMVRLARALDLDAARR